MTLFFREINNLPLPLASFNEKLEIPPQTFTHEIQIRSYASDVSGILQRNP
jgi:hypothetical protein